MDGLFCWLAYRVPKRLAYWCAIRVISNAAHCRPFTEMDALTPAQCLQAWK